jgi:hypothetical protein
MDWSLSRRWVDWTIGPLEDVDQHQAARALLAHANTGGIDLQVDAEPLAGVRRATLVYQRWADQRIGDQLDTLHQLPYGIEWTSRPSWPARSAASPRSSTTGRPDSWCRTTRAIRGRSGKPSQRPSTGSSPIQRWRRGSGRAGREHAIEQFSRPAIAERTVEIYRSLL